MQDESPLAFPKKADKPRLDAYNHYDKLYFGEHYEAFAIKAEKGFTDKYAKLRYITANFAGLASRVMADMLFGEHITFDVKDKSNQQWMDGLIEDNHLIAQLYESELGNSRRGDAIFKLRIGPAENNPSAKSTVIIEEITPAIYFPVLDASAPRNTPTEDVLAWTFKQNGKTYLHKETHRPGYIFHEIYEYDPNKEMIVRNMDVTEFGFKAMEETLVDDSLIFHIPNVRDGSSYFGTSDYKDLEQLFFALNNRITKVDNILDKHSDPILAVPPGVIDEEGKVKKESLGMFEVDNENTGFNKPEYIVWNANLEYAFKEIEALTDMLFMFSEISPATMGMEKSAGKAQSGTALKFKLLRTIAKRNRKKIYYDIAIKEMIETAMELGKAHSIKIDGVQVTTPEKPDIDWGDGIIPDQNELTTDEVARVGAGLSSRADSIVRLDGISPDEAKKKVVEIDKESSITVAPPDTKSTTTPPTAPTGPTPPATNPTAGATPSATGK